MANDGSNTVTHTFKCCQDDNVSLKRNLAAPKRDRQRMEGFAWERHLKLMIHLEPPSLSLDLHHLHAPYFDKYLSSEVVQFVQDNISSAPMEIFNKMTQLEIPGSERTMQCQIYYRWHQTNSNICKLDNDQLTSAAKYLESKGDAYSIRLFEQHDAWALAFNLQRIIAMVKGAVELVMHSTYGTNSSGVELFAVPAEVDGAGVPVCYMFVEKQGLGDHTRRTYDGAMTLIIIQFLRSL